MKKESKLDQQSNVQEENCVADKGKRILLCWVSGVVYDTMEGAVAVKSGSRCWSMLAVVKAAVWTRRVGASKQLLRRVYCTQAPGQSLYFGSHCHCIVLSHLAACDKETCFIWNVSLRCEEGRGEVDVARFKTDFGGNDRGL